MITRAVELNLLHWKNSCKMQFLALHVCLSKYDNLAPTGHFCEFYTGKFLVTSVDRFSFRQNLTKVMVYINTYVILQYYLPKFFLWWKKLQKSNVEKIKIPTFCQMHFSENCTVYYVVLRNTAEEGQRNVSWSKHDVASCRCNLHAAQIRTKYNHRVWYAVRNKLCNKGHIYTAVNPKIAQLTANNHLSVDSVPPTHYDLWMAILREVSNNGWQ
jgi:hypothetical protein